MMLFLEEFNVIFHFVNAFLFTSIALGIRESILKVMYFQHVLWIVLSSHCLWSLPTKR